MKTPLSEEAAQDRLASTTYLYPLLGLMVLFWSFNYVVGKIALREFPPMLLVGLRTALAGLILIPIYLWQEGTKSAVWSWKELRVLVPLGVCGVAGNQLFFVLGLSHTSVAHAAIIIATTPILVLLLAAAAGQEQVSLRKFIGMAIAFSGIAVLQVGHAQGSSSLVGDIYILLGAFSFSAFTVLGKSVSARHGGITVNTIAYVSGGLLLAPLIFWQGRHFPFAAISSLGWWCIFYMAAFSSVISYLIYYHALTQISASRVSVLSYFQPVLATLMAIPILREPLHPGLLLGGSLALAGVYVTGRR